MQIVLRGEIKCMWVKITCEEWKIWVGGELKRHKKLRIMEKIKRCRQCTSENIKHMRGEKM